MWVKVFSNPTEVAKITSNGFDTPISYLCPEYNNTGILIWN
jgi:hypothetical protein